MADATYQVRVSGAIPADLLADLAARHPSVGAVRSIGLFGIIELVKNRAYGSEGDAGQASARTALGLALEALLKLFAPFLPFVTEEVWSWWREGSIHRADWPDPSELADASATDPDAYEVAAWVLGEIRKAKALAKRSLRTEVLRVVIRDTKERLDLLRGVERDVREAGSVAAFEYVEADEPSPNPSLEADKLKEYLERMDPQDFGKFNP